MSATPATPGAGKLFDQLMATHHIKNDAALARALELKAPVISKHRNGVIPVGPTLIVNIAETFDMPVKAIKATLA